MGLARYVSWPDRKLAIFHLTPMIKICCRRPCCPLYFDPWQGLGYATVGQTRPEQASPGQDMADQAENRDSCSPSLAKELS